jgi:hypothetical protein
VSVTDDIKSAVAELRQLRTAPTRGQQIYELNLWLGEERKRLQDEYSRRLTEIEMQREPSAADRVSPKVLDLVGHAVAQKVSRSNIRRALGFSTLEETDEVIALATGQLREAVVEGRAEGFDLVPTGETHVKGWPMYKVVILPEGTVYSAVYLVTTPRTTEVERRHLRLSPSVPGSEEILDAVWSSGAAREIFARGKEES